MVLIVGDSPNVAGGGGVSLTNDSLTITSDGQTVFTLSGTPANPTTALLFLNGQQLAEPADFTIAGDTLTMTLTSFILETIDTFEIFWS